MLMQHNESKLSSTPIDHRGLSALVNYRIFWKISPLEHLKQLGTNPDQAEAINLFQMISSCLLNDINVTDFKSELKNSSKDQKDDKDKKVTATVKKTFSTEWNK